MREPRLMQRRYPGFRACLWSSSVLAGCLLPDAVLEQDVARAMPGGQGGAAARVEPTSTDSVGMDTLDPAIGTLPSTEAPPELTLPAASGGSSGAPAQLQADAGASSPNEPDAGQVVPPPVVSPSEQCASAQGTLEPGTTVCLFFASLARVTWQAADLACQTRNSELVSIQTFARDDFLTTLIGTTDVWIGAIDPGTSAAANAFVWRDGSLLAFSNWAEGEPDGLADQFCVTKTGEPGEPPAPWRDRPCSELKAYVCEQTL